MHDSYQGLTDKKNRDKIIPSTRVFLDTFFKVENYITAKMFKRTKNITALTKNKIGIGGADQVASSHHWRHQRREPKK
jgi:hypothetical protein